MTSPEVASREQCLVIRRDRRAPLALGRFYPRPGHRLRFAGRHPRRDRRLRSRIRSAADAPRRAGRECDAAWRPGRVGLAQLLHSDAHADGQLARRRELHGRARRGGGEVARAAAPRRAGHVARDRARDSRLAQPVRPGIRQVPLRAPRRVRAAADDPGREPDVRACRAAERSERRANERAPDTRPRLHARASGPPT